jgi:hypothetical protein
LLHEEKTLLVIATKSKHWHPSSQQFAEIPTTSLPQTLFVEYQFASRRVERWSGGYEHV